MPSKDGIGTVKLLTDEDYPPFSFRDASGTMTGLTVELALGACAELALACEIVPVPWGELKPALEAGRGNAIISGLRMTPESAEGVDATRPYFRSLGRFAIQAKTEITDITPGAIAGKKVAVVKGSGHAAWMARHFPKSEIVQFNRGAEARTALKSGQAELLFGDALELIYWINGEDAAKCCKLLPGAYVDARYFSHPMIYLVRRGDTPLKRLLDFGLDRMQTNGKFTEIFKRYVPLNPW